MRFEELFPGIARDLADAGAVPLRAGLDVIVERPGYDPFPQRDLEIVVYSMSRPLIELVVRRRLGERRNVVLREGARVGSFAATPDGSALTAVRYDAADGKSETLPFDLAIDASGRGALTLDLLKTIDRSPPEETVIGIDIAYATAIFAIPEETPADFKGAYLFPDAPQTSRGALPCPSRAGAGSSRSSARTATRRPPITQASSPSRSRCAGRRCSRRSGAPRCSAPSPALLFPAVCGGISSASPTFRADFSRWRTPPVVSTLSTARA